MPDVGDEFVREFTAHQRRLFLTILSQVGNPTDAEEILQNTNLVLWRKAERFTPGTSFAAWSQTVAGFEVLKWREKRGRDRHRFSAELVATLAEEVAEHAELWEERRAALAVCLEKLGRKDRDLVRRRYAAPVDGKEVAGIDVAADLGRPVNAVYQSLGRIRRTLAECIRRELAAVGHPEPP